MLLTLGASGCDVAGVMLENLDGKEVFLTCAAFVISWTILYHKARLFKKKNSMRALLASLSFLLFGIGLVESQKSQIWVGPSDVGTNPRWATESDFDGSSLVFCRGYYKQNRQDENVVGWYVDYPGADINFLIRLAELTKIKIRLDNTGSPIHVVVRLDSPLIFKCPVLFLSDVGTIGLTEDEIANLRKYLEKGGFIWADDFWGSKGWDQWERQIRLVLPYEHYFLIDIPTTHPIRHQFFDISEIIQVPNIGFWSIYKPQTSELGEDSKEVNFRGFEDRKGRLVVVTTHNTDIGETWEKEASDPTNEFFYRFSTFGYALGINIFLYALSH